MVKSRALGACSRIIGMKAHFGVDSRTKLIHSVVATPANAADSTVLPELLHGQETRVWGDQAYRGQRTVIREHAPKARDFTKGQTITLWLNYLALPSDSRTRPASVLGSSAMASRITTRGAT